MSGTSELSTPKILTYDGTAEVQTLPAGVTQGGRSIHAFWDATNSDFNLVSVGLEGQVTYNAAWTAAAAGSWGDGNSGFDGTMYDIDFAASAYNIGYMVGDQGYLGRTTNTAGSFTQLTGADAGTQVFRGVAVTGTTAPYTMYAVSSAGGIYTSNSGITTASRMTTPTTNYLRAASCFTPTDCFAVGHVPTIVQYNGASWTNVVLTNSANDYYGVTTYMTGATRHAIIVGANGVTRALTTATWASEVLNASTGSWLAVAANGTGTGTALAISTNAHVYKTTNHGASWANAATIPAASTLLGIAWGGGTTWFVSVGEGQIWKSTDDGTNWTLLLSNSGTAQHLYGIGWCGAGAPNFMAACGINGTVLRSLYGGE